MPETSIAPELTMKSAMQDFYEEFAQSAFPDLTYDEFTTKYGLFEPELPEEPTEWDADAEMQRLIAGDIPPLEVIETPVSTETASPLPLSEPKVVAEPSEAKQRWRRVGRVGLLAGAVAVVATVGISVGLIGTSALHSQSESSQAAVVAAPITGVAVTAEPAPASTTTTTEVAPTTEAVAPPFRPAAGEQSAVLRFGEGMCNEEISIREAPAEYGVNADESILNTLELDPTPQAGCEAGTSYVEAARANGGKNRTREDGGRFVIEDWNALPTLPDGSHPTNPGQLQPIAERSMASNMFGESGVVYVDGHRSTESAPFALLDNNAPGDKIVAARGDGKNFDYTVNRVASIPVGTYQQDLLAIIDQIRAQAGHENVLVISACDPYGSKTHRVVLFATLDDER